MIINQLTNIPKSVFRFLIFASVIVSITSSCKKEDAVVEDPTVSGLLIKAAPTQIDDYLPGEKLNLSGLVVSIKMDNGIEEDVALANFESKGISCVPDDGSILLESNTGVEIKHTATGKIANQPIGVVTLKDIDGNSYRIVRIGEQFWMAENLKTTHFIDGTSIPLVTDDIAWAGLEDNDTGEGYCYYNNDESYADKYGALYTYAAAVKACPEGWHIPSTEEWNELETFIINDLSSDSVVIALQDSIEWRIPRDGIKGTNNYGFSALPGGNRDAKTGGFRNKEMEADWWSSTQDHEMDIKNRYRFLYYLDSEMTREGRCKSYGHSVRCIRD